MLLNANQNNVRQVKASEALRCASAELVGRALDFWKVLDQHRGELAKPMERAGRKANPLVADSVASPTV